MYDSHYFGNLSYILNGPDGMPYFALFSVQDGETIDLGSEIETHKIEFPLAVQRASERGCGLVFEPDNPAQRSILSYGSVWSLRHYGSAEAKPHFEFQAPPAQESNFGSSAFFCPPTEQLFPSWARLVLRAAFEDVLRISPAKVGFLIEATDDPCPAIVFNIFQELDSASAHFDSKMRFLDWHLPSCFELRAIAQDSDVAALLEPL